MAPIFLIHFHNDSSLKSAQMVCYQTLDVINLLLNRTNFKPHWEPPRTLCDPTPILHRNSLRIRTAMALGTYTSNMRANQRNYAGV
ncbi:protein of unknown function [Magnetospira sp. QH-2]|nr:protein of unknown function [Magnetospira sp. QH-2]